MMEAAELEKFIATVKRDVSIYRSTSSGTFSHHPTVAMQKGLRRRTWLTAIEAAAALRKPLTIVETGVARDNLSTWLWAEVVKFFGGHVHSVDIDSNLCQLVRSVLADVGLSDYVSISCDDSIAFIRGFEHAIDVLYLDSYDLEPTAPYPSMQHHLSELQAALPKLSEEAIVLVDDTPTSKAWVPARPDWRRAMAKYASLESPRGKGTLCIEFLASQDHHRVTTLAHEYQVVWRLTRLSRPLSS